MAKAQNTSMADQPGVAPAADSKAAEAPTSAPAATVASDAPAAVGAALAPTDAPTAQPAAPAATLDDVAALRAQLAEATANNDAKIQAAVAAAVGAALAHLSHPTRNNDEATAEQLLVRMEKERKDREAANAKIEDWLESGPEKFDISMTNEPRMNKRVGGVSQDEAHAKYMRYFGITAIVDPQKRVSVAPVVK